jgi:hypothetical protein
MLLTVWIVGAIVVLGLLLFNYHSDPYEPPSDAPLGLKPGGFLGYASRWYVSAQRPRPGPV